MGGPLKREHVLIFDELVPSQTAVVSRVEHHQLLARYDQVALHVQVTNTTGSAGSISVFIEHSADGKSFVQKNATKEINAASLVVPGGGGAVGGDGGALPTLEFARLNVKLDSGITSGLVRIWATFRDAGI